MDSPHSNTIIGANIHGPVLQARDIAAVHVHTPSPPAAPVPRQLPARAAWFTDRANTLAWLEHRWHPTSQCAEAALLVLIGPAGVGKSAAAVDWLNEHPARFPHGHLHLDLRPHSPDTSESHRTLGALGTMLISLGVPPDRLPEHPQDRASLLRTAAHGKRLCLLLEDPASAAQVRTLRLHAPGCLTLVTSRAPLHALARDDAHTHRIDPWPPAVGRDLLTRALGRERIEAEPEPALQLSRLCGGLPLALAICAARLKAHPGHPISRLVHALTPESQRLDHLALEDDTVNAVFDNAYSTLRPDLARLYRALGALPVVWIDAPMAAAALNIPIERSEDLLGDLVEAVLLDQPHPGRFALAGLLKGHAARCADADPQESAQAVGGLLDYLLHTATAAEAILTPSHRSLARNYTTTPPQSPLHDAAAALDWLDRHKENLLPAVRYCAQTHRHRTAWQLVDAWWPLFLRRRVPDIRLPAQQIALESARADGDRDAIGRFLTSLAGTLLGAGRLEEAAEHDRQAIALYHETGDLRGLAQASNGLAKALLAAGDLDAAERHFQDALDLRLQIGYGRGVQLTRHGQGQVAFARGDLRLALSLFDAAYHGLMDEGDLYDAAWSLALGAQARAGLGEAERALEDLHRALEQMRAAGSAHGQVGVLEITASVQQAEGRNHEARTSLQAASTLAEYDPAAQQRIREALDAQA